MRIGAGMYDDGKPPKLWISFIPVDDDGQELNADGLPDMDSTDVVVVPRIGEWIAFPDSQDPWVVRVVYWSMPQWGARVPTQHATLHVSRVTGLPSWGTPAD